MWAQATAEPPAFPGEGTYARSQMVDISSGWAAGRKLWKTQDGGMSWSDRSPANKEGSYGLLDLVDSNTVLAGYYPPEREGEVVSNDLAEPELNQQPVYLTVDGGEHWEELAHPLKGRWGVHPAVTIYGMQFANQDTGYVYAYAEPGMVEEKKSLFLQTTDSGRHWSVRSEDITNQETMGYAVPYGMVLRDNKEPWIPFINTECGKPVVIKSTTSGRTWERVKMDLPAQAADAVTYPITDPMFWGDHHADGLMANTFSRDNIVEGIIWYRTSDGGMTWSSSVSTYEGVTARQPTASPNGTNLIVYAYDTSSLWILDQAHGELYHSADGGKTWRLLGSSPSFQQVQGLIFSSPLEGRVYSTATNYYTQDGGKTWVEQEQHSGAVE